MTHTPEQALLENNRLLRSLLAVQTAFIQGHPTPRLFEQLLSTLLELTGSECGFIGEVVLTPEGKPTLQPHALTNIPWTGGLRERFTGEGSQGLTFSALQSLFGAVLMSGQPVVLNHLITDVARGEGSSRAPRSLHSFLGLPFHSGGELVGMVGLANRPGGYDGSLITFLEPCLSTCCGLLVRLRSERRRHPAEDSLWSSEESFYTLIEQSPDAILIHRDGTLLFANPAAVALMGLEGTQELVGRPVEECVLPGQEVGLTEPSSGTAPREVRFRHRTGRQAVGEVVTVCLLFGGAPAFVCIARDITERRQAQERLLATERLASLGTMAAGVAQEINNPLAYMLSNLSYVSEELYAMAETGEPLKGARAKDILDALEETLSGSRHVRDVVRDLKLFSRVQTDQHGLLHLHTLLDACVNMAWGEIKHRARLVKDYGAVPPIYGNESRLAQVFLHLILNAVQALPSQGGETCEIRLTTRHEEGVVMVAVHDTGVGIPEENLGRLFAPFFTTKPSSEATGLGLTICHGIVTSLGGRITVDSQPGRGSTFRVFLPTNVLSSRSDMPVRPHRREERDERVKQEAAEAAQGSES